MKCNFFFFYSKMFVFFSYVLCLWSLSCLMEYQCLFHVMYEPYINVRHRKYIVLVPMLYKRRRFTFLCFSLQDGISEALHSYSSSLLPHQITQNTFAFCALLKKNCCIYIILLHLDSSPNTSKPCTT